MRILEGIIRGDFVLRNGVACISSQYGRQVIQLLLDSASVGRGGCFLYTSGLYIVCLEFAFAS